MPSVSSLSQDVFNNLGPLTTTYTAPASCATLTNNYVLSSADIWGYQYRPDCNTATSTLGDCLPSGSALDAQYASASNRPSNHWTINYFSPAVDCPSAWTTVGVAARDGGGSLSSEGVFTTGEPRVRDGQYVSADPANVLMTALARDETVVMCCPTNYEAKDAACVSTVPASQNTYTSGCNYVLNYDDYTFVTTTATLSHTTVTDDVVKITGTAPVTDKQETTFDSFDATDWNAVAVMPMVTLLNKGPAPTAKSSSAASGGRGPSFGGGKSAAVCAAIWGVAALAGAVLAIPL